MLRNHPSAIRVVLLVTLVALVGTVAEAQRRPQGLRIGVVNTDASNMQATLEVTLNTTIGSYVYTTGGTTYSPGSTVTYTIQQGMLGSMIVSWSGWGFGYLVSPTINAVEFGDSAGTVAGTTIPLVPPGSTPGSFRGEFAHTYPDFGDYTATTGAACVWMYHATPNNVHVTGITSGEPYLLQAGDSFVTSNTYWGTTPVRTVGTHTAYPTASYAIGLVNSTMVTLQDRAIPSLLPVGLMVLAGLLATAGWVLLRRT